MLEIYFVNPILTKIEFTNTMNANGNVMHGNLTEIQLLWKIWEKK